MLVGEFPSQNQHVPQPDRLLAVVLKYQQDYRAWSEATEPELRESLRQMHRASFEELWALLESHLLGVARGWQRSDVGHDNDLQSLAFILFSYIIETLPHLHIDPHLNLRNYLLKIARNGIYDENRKIYSRTPGPRKTPSKHVIAAERRASAMWPEYTKESTASIDVADPQSIEQEAALIKAIHAQECWPRIYEFLSTKLSDEDQKIIRMRIAENPPIKFEDIACALGDGWEAATVRQRYRRGLAKIRRRLLNLGLIEDRD